MADYVSSLTGVQMDAALLDMAEHNSEAYAVGERNGIAVASDDVTYHNNARYYAQIASSQIVGDASSAVRWDTDQSEVLTDAQKAQARENINAASDSDVVKITAQTLTSAQQEQARVNIMAGGSNRNLLDNPWFTVNQRGQTTYSGGGGVTVDRWKLYGLSTNSVVVSSDGVTVTAPDADFVQYWDTERASQLNGKTCTYSFMDFDGNIASFTTTYQNTGLKNTSVTLGGKSFTVYIGRSRGLDIGMCITSANGANLRAVKLELGSVSTLANDAPPKYKSEFDEVAYYFRRIKNTLGGTKTIATGYVNASTQAYFVLPYTMRTLTASNAPFTAVAVYNGSSYISATSILLDQTSDTIALIVNVASGLTAGQTCRLVLQTGGYIDLPADL